MKVFKIETIDGTYEITGTRHEMGKYCTVYNGAEVVFETRSTKVLSIK